MTEIMMTYKPSPKPNFIKPTHIEYKSMDTYMWGDEEAGNVKDWIYVSNENLHQIIFGMEKGGNFKHSNQYRTIFGADELLYVLSGTLVINNPETGDAQKINKGESVFFQKDTWHHSSYNRSVDNTLDPSFINQKSFKIIKESDYIYSIEGPNQEVLIGTLIKSEFLDVRMITLNAFKKSHKFKFDKNTSYLSLDDNLKINLINEKTEYSLSKKDGLYFPSSTEFTVENLNDFDARIIICVGI